MRSMLKIAARGCTLAGPSAAVVRPSVRPRPSLGRGCHSRQSSSMASPAHRASSIDSSGDEAVAAGVSVEGSSASRAIPFEDHQMLVWTTSGMLRRSDASQLRAKLEDEYGKHGWKAHAVSCPACDTGTLTQHGTSLRETFPATTQWKCSNAGCKHASALLGGIVV